MTDAGVPYSEPPRSHGAPGAWRSDERFKAQLAVEGARAEPLTEAEHQALMLQRRNPGPLVPPLRARFLERADAELKARQAAAGGRVIRVEDPYDRATIGSMAERGRHERALNRPQDPHRSMLRPGPRQHRPYDDGNDCIDGDAISFRR